MEYRPERYLIHRRVSMTDRGGSRRCIRVTAFQDRSMVPDSLQSAQKLPLELNCAEWLKLGRKRKGSFYIFERIKRTATADRIASRCIRQ